MNTEIEIEVALYKVLKNAPVETVIRCLGRVCHDIEQQTKRDKKKTNSGAWAMYGDKLTELAS